MDGKRVIGIDLGGTKILAGVVDDRGQVERRREYPTPTGSQDELLGGLDTAIAELLTVDIAALGFGLPSPIDQKAGRALQAVNIPLDESVDFRGRMRERFDLPVGIENDANAAAYAEFRFGAARDVETMVARSWTGSSSVAGPSSATWSSSTTAFRVRERARVVGTSSPT